MDRLPKSANKLLKQINSLKSFDITPGKLSMIKLLEDKGYIKFHQSLSLDALIENSNWLFYLTISTDGKIYLSDNKHTTLKYWIPIVISNLIAITALIFSIFSLVMR